MLWKGNKYGSSAPRKGTKLREGKGKKRREETDRTRRNNNPNSEPLSVRGSGRLSLCLRLLWQKSVGKGRGRKASGHSNGAPTALEMGDAGRADAPCADDDACAPGRDSGSKAAQGWKKEGFARKACSNL